MAIDYAVTLDCAARRHFGGGDASRGTLDILDRLKARNRAESVREFARQQGLTNVSPTVTVQTQDAQGNLVEKQISVVEMEAEAMPLDAHAAACAGCPANFQARPYGCYGAINYPVSQAGEAWLLSRVQPPGTMGAQLCAEFMKEFRVSGDGIRQLRGQGLYEAGKAGKVTLIKGLLKGTSLSGDQLLETIFQAGDSLVPSHCFGILIWLGAIRVDGVVPSSLEDQATLQKLLSLTPGEAREKHTQLELGAESPPESTMDFQCLVAALYLCWVFDVPLYISS